MKSFLILTVNLTIKFLMSIVSNTSNNGIYSFQYQKPSEACLSSVYQNKFHRLSCDSLKSMTIIQKIILSFTFAVVSLGVALSMWGHPIVGCAVTLTGIGVGSYFFTFFSLESTPFPPRQSAQK